MSRRVDSRREAQPIVDWNAGFLDLEDGYRLAWAVDGDGDRQLWLIAPLCDGCEDVTRHGSTADAGHEQLGPIPASVRRRLFDDPRCGGPTTTGRPCRHRVAHLGDRCALHLEESTR